MPKELETTEETSRIDYGIVFSVFMLALVGLMSIYVAVLHDTSGSDPVRAVIMQAVWYVIGGIAIVIIMQFDSEQLWRIAPLVYGVGIFLLIAVLFLYNRQVATQTGAKSWFALGPISFQPSEVMKPAYILMLGRVVT